MRRQRTTPSRFGVGTRTEPFPPTPPSVPVLSRQGGSGWRRLNRPTKTSTPHCNGGELILTKSRSVKCRIRMPQFSAGRLASSTPSRTRAIANIRSRRFLHPGTDSPLPGEARLLDLSIARNPYCHQSLPCLDARSSSNQITPLVGIPLSRKSGGREHWYYRRVFRLTSCIISRGKVIYD